MKNLSDRLKEYAHSTQIINGVTIQLQGYAGRNKSNNALFYASCPLCMEDFEMYPEPFIVEKGTLDRGVLPCGCAKSPRYTLRQYEIRINRELSRRGLGEIYLGGLPEDKKINNKMKIFIQKSCGEIYKVSLTHFFTSESGLRKRGTFHKIDDKDFLDVTYERTNLKSVENFKVDFDTGEVSYYCTKCKGDYTTQRKYLLSGRVPCSCASRPNFNKAKPANLYIVRWFDSQNSYLKFGITNRVVLDRVKDQYRNTNLDYEILHIFHHESGQAVWDCEKLIKQSVQTSICPKELLPDGYTETTHDTSEVLQQILATIKDNL